MGRYGESPQTSAMKYLLLIFTIFCSGCTLASYKADIDYIVKDTPIKHTRFKGRLWCWLNRHAAYITLGDTLYLDKNEWEVLSRGSHVYFNIQAMVVHESIHSIRQQKSGLIIWLFKYITNPRFRWEEEKLGYLAEWKYYLILGFIIEEEQYRDFAKEVSSGTYFRMVSYEEAYIFICRSVYEIKRKIAHGAYLPKTN